jgi:leucyl aminopeptidase
MAPSQLPTVVDVNLVQNLSASLADHDALVIVATQLDEINGFVDISVVNDLQAYLHINQNFNNEVTLIINDKVPGKRLIYSPTGVVTRDYDDVRRFSDAASAGVKKALSVGSRSPVVASFGSKQYQQATLVTLLAALEATYVPLQVREDIPERQSKADRLGFLIGQTSADNGYNERLVNYARAVEFGRAVGRDIGGSDPERMPPPRVAEYVQELFKSSSVKVNVVKDKKEFEKNFPLFAAVNRAASVVDRHNGRLIFLEYTGEGTIDTTALFVGKGITFDTGGLDIKAGGVMAGMSYDKCGAANVTGFFKVLAELKPKQFKAIGVLAVARNNCGEEGYTADEIITTRAGLRIRVGNTDAEGRMVMADPLCYIKELALNEVNPQLFTMATLTGHVIRAYGENYTAAIDNGPAQASLTAQRLQAAGEAVGDPFEISTVRREDFEFIADRGEVADVLQCNNQASSATARGHQFPAAFLARASGLDKHGRDSAQPLRYTHLDIAGSGGELPHSPTGRPIPALCQLFLAERVL